MCYFILPSPRRCNPAEKLSMAVGQVSISRETQCYFYYRVNQLWQEAEVRAVQNRRSDLSPNRSLRQLSIICDFEQEPLLCTLYIRRYFSTCSAVISVSTTNVKQHTIYLPYNNISTECYILNIIVFFCTKCIQSL